MKVLALDLSSKTGWAVLDSELQAPQNLLYKGVIESESKILDFPGGYPFNVRNAAIQTARRVRELMEIHVPDVVVVEEINLGKMRLAQRFLDWTHLSVVQAFMSYWHRRPDRTDDKPKLVYVSSSAWRHALGQRMTHEDKKNNKKLKAARSGAQQGAAADLRVLKAAGVRGKIGTKHLSVRWVNEKYGLNLKMKDDDIADAISLGAGFLAGAEVCDGR